MNGIMSSSHCEERSNLANKDQNKVETLNLAYHEKRLIELALKKANGNVAKAYELNVPKKNYMTYRTYLYKVNHVYKLKTIRSTKKGKLSSF
jgi:hypothetical protein